MQIQENGGIAETGSRPAFAEETSTVIASTLNRKGQRALSRNTRTILVVASGFSSMIQFPSKMGEMAVKAIVTAVNGGEKPSGFHNTGTVLITDHPVEGLESKDSKWGLDNCWGG